MTTRERLTLAALVSLGLHALLISGGWLPMPAPLSEHQPLTARLAPLPPATEPIVPSSPPPGKSRPRRTAPSAAPPPPAVIAQAAVPAPALPVPVADSSDAPPSAAALAEPPQEQEPRPAPPQEQPSAAATADPAPARSLPKKGSITYALTLAGDGFSVGRAVQSWEVGGGTYKLVSDAETTGIVDLFRPQRLRWLSKGRITRQGLRPESFLVSRTRHGQTEASEARFDWNAGSLTYGAAPERASAALPGDAQDIMSFIYQLSLAPPAPGSYRMPITNGSKFETYEIEVRAEERIETPLGTVRTVPVKQRRQPGAESIEIWLAAEYRYLPVRIRYFDRSGNPAGEQVASDIRVSDD